MKQLRFTTPSLHKENIINLFLILVAALMVLPFMSTFNDLLTQFVMRLDAYKYIQNYVVPYQVRMVGVLLYPFGLQPAIMGEYLALRTGSGKPFLIEIAWNCIGWQSLLFFFITAIVGLQGDMYTGGSKIKAAVIGFLGTFLVNLIRIAFVAIVAMLVGQNFAMIVHDYGSTLAVLTWLLFFWWFVYKYVLEEKGSLNQA